MKNLSTLLILLALTGCAGLTESSVSSAPGVVPVSASTSGMVKAPAPSVTPGVGTAALIQQLDVAGCDFSGLAISENKTRKNSSTLVVTCK